MFDLQLFFGVAIDKEMMSHLKNAPIFLKNSLIQNNDDYLQEMTFENVTYLGKKLDKVIDIQNLEMIEKNIASLIQKLLPNYSLTPLTIFPYDAS